MKDEAGRLSGYGIHGDKRMKRKRTRGTETDDTAPLCDRCGKRNAKQSHNWQMLCIECRKIEELEDDDGYDD